MNTDLLLQLTLVALNHTAELNALLQRVQAEGRKDLTADEVAQVRAIAASHNAALTAAIGA